MPFNFYDTHTLLMAVRELDRPSSFLRDRYFPTNMATDVFSTNDVLVEFQDGSKKLAPFVAPRKGGVTIMRNGYEMKRYEPPRIAPKRTLKNDDLTKRGFGEAILSTLTPEQRQRTLLLSDADQLSNLITRREEAMAAEVLQTNGCVMKHIADDKDVSDDMEVRYYSEGKNPASYEPATKWDQSEATNDSGKNVPYIEKGNCVLTAPNAGRTVYGAVTQVEQSDGEFHTYTGMRVPKYLSNADENTRTLTLTARPLLMPNNKNPFIMSKVLTA